MTRDTRINLSIAAAATLLALYAGELVLTVRPLPTQSQRLMARTARLAREQHVAADPRTERQVVRDLRRLGIDAWPGLSSATRLNIHRTPGADSTLQPLAGISGVLTVMCNESGPWIMYRADEHGFTNPAGRWGLPRADVALIGDSFVQGMCLHAASTFSSLIRARYPATVAAGIAASGPLNELGLLREYLAPLRPRVVLWFYYEGNDLSDMEREKVRPVARRYLEPGFTQHLAASQAEVDARLKAHVLATDSEDLRRESAPLASPVRRLLAGLALRNLREAASRLRPVPEAACCDVPFFRQVMHRAAEDVRAWGGRLVFVYLPAEVTLTGGHGSPHPSSINAVESVRALVRQEGLPLLDLRDSLRHYGPPELLYPPAGHLTVRGQRVVADIMLRYLACVDSITVAPARAIVSVPAPHQGVRTDCPPATPADTAAATSRANGSSATGRRP